MVELSPSLIQDLWKIGGQGQSTSSTFAAALLREILRFPATINQQSFDVLYSMTKVASKSNDAWGACSSMLPMDLFRSLLERITQERDVGFLLRIMEEGALNGMPLLMERYHYDVCVCL